MSSVLDLLPPAMAACARACEEVHDACELAIRDGLKKSTLYADVNYIGTLLDCALMARTARDFMLRQSELHDIACQACAEVCLACARKCFAVGESGIVELCHRCAELCRNPHNVAEDACRTIEQPGGAT